MMAGVPRTGTEGQQEAFFANVAEAYGRCLASFCADLERIITLAPRARLQTLEQYHPSFPARAAGFLSDLSGALAITVRQASRLDAVRGTTTVQLAEELLTEAYGPVLQSIADGSAEVTQLARQISQAAAAGAASAAAAASVNVFDAALSKGATWAQAGRLFGGNGVRWGIDGAISGMTAALEQRIVALNESMAALVAESKARQQRRPAQDAMLQEFLNGLASSVERLFDWAGTRVFGPAVSLELIRSAAQAGNLHLAERILPFCEKLSQGATAQEIQKAEEAAAERLRQEQEAAAEWERAERWAKLTPFVLASFLVGACILVSVVAPMSSPITANSPAPSASRASAGSTPSGADWFAEVKRYLNAKDYAKALPLLQEAAEAGNGQAMNSLGDLYYYGQGVAQDDDQARYWYQKAAEAGNTGSMDNLGYLYRYGRGVGQDYTQARYWYQKAADKNDAWGMYNLGCLYENGRGVAQDPRRALSWYRKAVEAGASWANYDVTRLQQ